MRATSVCVKCKNLNSHEVDHDGRASVTCSSCGTEYSVRSYTVRAKGGRRDKKSGIKHYNIRVKEPDRDEDVLEFDSSQEIEMRSGDQITGSYLNGKLKYLLNQTIKKYWDVHPGGSGGGCIGCFALIVIIAAGVAAYIYFFR